MIPNFRDTMAGIPTCVGVLIVEHEGDISGCTISSFTSLSVDEGSEKVLFVLRSNSQTGLHLKELGNGTVSILEATQAEIARAAGGNLKSAGLTRFLGENSESSISGFPSIRDSCTSFELVLEETVKIDNAELFICKVVGVRQFDPGYSHPMVYLNRKFGHFESNA